MVNVNELSSVALAYVGDAVYELHVRNFLIRQGHIKPQQLHNIAIKFVSAPSQAKVVISWLEEGFLSKKEEAIVRRGRNAKTHSVPKNIPIKDYKYATAFEALIGYLYLNEQAERLKVLIESAIEYVSKRL